MSFCCLGSIDLTEGESTFPNVRGRSLVISEQPQNLAWPLYLWHLCDALCAGSVLWQVGCSTGRAHPAPGPPHCMETRTRQCSPLSFCQEHAAKPPVPPAESCPCCLPQNLCISPIKTSKRHFQEEFGASLRVD